MNHPSLFPGFSTEALTELYSPESVVAAMLRFEEALALALADAGLAPQDEADAVAAACRSGVPDPETVLASTWDEGTPLIALRESVTSGLTEGSARWFHFGATTQDTIDTAQVIQARAALALLDDQLVIIARRLRELTVEYRDQPQMGRTFLQNARPTTFGFRTATWLNAVVNHIRDLRRVGNDLHFQLGGPVGTLGVYGDSAADVLGAMAERLGLAVPDISWHTDRSRMVELAQTVQRTANTMAKIGSDLALLASSAIAEIRVRSGGSSSMPEKRNPLDSLRAVAASRACTGAVGMLTSGSGHELDRGTGGWHIEWLALPLVFQTGGAAAEAIGTCLESLDVDRPAMSTHAGSSESAENPIRIDRVLAACDRILA